MNEREIFANALQKATATERSDYLNQVCGGDSPLRARIEKLLAQQSSLGSFMEHPPVQVHLGELAAAGLAIPLTAADPDRTTLGSGQVHLDFLAPSEKPDCLGLLGQYEILEVVGRGGMGIVLKGNDTRLNRIVAIKVLAPEIASNPTAHKRFLREAQAAAAVSHDHIVTFYAVEEQPVPHLVMEYIDGRSLQQKIDAEGQLELKDVLRIGRQIAAGLAAAHEQGLTHRDIKPSNVLLRNGIQRVQITDFGLARATADADITRTGELAGTPQYMSPEQAKSQPVDQRSDLFSLGSVLYAMCTGHSPFRAATPLSVLKRVCDDKPRSLRENNSEIPNWLVAIIEKLLAKNPDDRFQTAAEVAELLSKCLSHVQNPSSTSFPDTIRTLERQSTKAAWPQRRWLIAALMLIAVGMMLGATEATGVTSFSGTVVRIVTGEGTLVIEVDDPTVEVSLDGEELSIAGTGLQELRLRPGQYQLRATKDGEPVKQELVTVTRGGRQLVNVRLESSSLATGAKRDATHGDSSKKTARLNPSEAIQHYSEIIRLRPDVALAYVYRADAYRKKGDYEKAINDCVAALRIDQTLAIAFEKRGLIYYEMEAYRKAIADLNESIRLAPENAPSYQTRGAAFFGLGRYEDALADVNKTLELAPNAVVTMMVRAQILVISQRTKDYQQACTEVLDRFSESNDPIVFGHAARTCVLAPNAIPNPMQTVELAARAVDLYPRGSYPRQWLLYTLGMAHLRAGSVDEASQCFHDSLTADPKWYASALDWLGLALVEQRRGDTKKTRQWLDKAIESLEQHPPPHPQDRIEAELLRREVEQLLGQSGAASD